jgi:hypothetical protein
LNIFAFRFFNGNTILAAISDMAQHKIATIGKSFFFLPDIFRPSMMVKERQNDKRIQHDELGESPTNSSGLDVSVAPATKKLRPAPAFVLAVESAFVSGGHTDPHESESASGPVAAADKQGKYIVSCAVQTQDTSLTRRKCSISLTRPFGSRRMEHHENYWRAELGRLLALCTQMSGKHLKRLISLFS